MAKHYKDDESGLAVPEPAFLFVVRQPKAISWPEGVPQTQELESYFKVFGGGVLGPQIVLHSLEEVREETDRWFNLLKDDENFWGEVDEKNCVVIANDPDGAPWVYNTQTGQIASYWWKESSWEEPICTSLANFIEFVFAPHEGGDDWEKVKQQAGIKA